MHMQLSRIKDWVEQLEKEDRQADTGTKMALKNYSEWVHTLLFSLSLNYTRTRTLLEIQEEVNKATSQNRSKSGFMKALKRVGAAKLEQEVIIRLNDRVDKTFKRFSVSTFGSSWEVSLTRYRKLCHLCCLSKSRN